MLEVESDNSGLRNKLINSLFGFYLIYCTILVTARQLISHSKELNYTVTDVDIGWFSLLFIIYSAGLISAIALRSPRNKYLIKSFAILLTTITASLWGAYVFGLETSTNILITQIGGRTYWKDLAKHANTTEIQFQYRFDQQCSNCQFLLARWHRYKSRKN